MLPSSYTEDLLQNYMIGRVENIANILGLDVRSFAEAVNDVLTAYGVADIVLATNISKLRGLAHIQAWSVIADEASSEHQFAVDGGSFNRKQIYDNAVATLERLKVTYAQYLPVQDASIQEYEMEVGTTTHYDAYEGLPDVFA